MNHQQQTLIDKNKISEDDIIQLSPEIDIDDERCFVTRKDFWKIIPTDTINNIVNLCLKCKEKQMKEVLEKYNIKQEELVSFLDLEIINVILMELLGNDIFQWAEYFAKMKDDALSQTFFQLYRPILYRDVSLVGVEFIIGTLLQYQMNESFQFYLYQPAFTYTVEHKDIHLPPKEILSKKRYIVFLLNPVLITKEIIKDTGRDYGVHWVSILYDTKNKFLEYYDSLGSSISKNPIQNSFLKKFIDSLYFALNKIFPQLTPMIYYLSKRKQFGGDLCGVFTVHFILQRLRNKKTMMEINEDTSINDTLMQKYRSIYWNQFNHRPF